VNAGEMEHRRVKHNFLVSRTVPNSLFTLVPGAILLTGADRNDVVVAVAMAALRKIPIAGLILAGDIPIDERIIEFCRPALETGVPLLHVRTHSYETATQLSQISSAVPAEDVERTRAGVEHKHKGLSMEMAASQLEDNVVLGTMMLALGGWTAWSPGLFTRLQIRSGLRCR
jgi:phosphate acetyltransferase